MSKRNKSSKKHAPRNRLGTFSPSAPLISLLAGIALIVVTAFIAYFPTLSNGFVWDDDALLINNSLIRSTEGLYLFWSTTDQMDYWPVTYTTLWIEWRLWGMNATGYHVTNLLLHIVASMLIWIILRKLSIPGAFLTALIFTVHPVNVESVAWIAQRKNTLAMLFFLLSILWYLKFLKFARRPTDHADQCCASVPDGARRCPLAAKQIPSAVHHPLSTFSSFILHPSSFHLWYWLSLAAFILAMLSKGSVAVLPVLLLGIVWWLRPLTRWDLARSAPFFVVAVALAGVNVWFQTHGTGEVIRSAGFAERLLGAGGVVWFYLYKALLPINLIFIYPSWRIEPGNLLWWLPLSSSLVVTAVLWWYRKTWSRPYLFAWGFFCVALVPVMGFTDVYFMKYTLVADHYQHIAIIGAIALAAAPWSHWRRRTMQPAAIIAAALVCILIFLTWEQNRTYHDVQTLYQTTIDRNPSCWMAHNNLGGLLYGTGRRQEAIVHFRQALRFNPVYLEAHNNLGVALDETGSSQEAIEHFKEALRLKPDYTDAHYNLGNALKTLGQYQQAIEHYQQALRLKPDYTNAHLNMGNILKALGQNQQALEHYRQALRLQPDYAVVHNNLGILLVDEDRLPEAIEHFELALRFKPNYDEAYSNLAAAYIKIGRPDQAIATARKAVELARSQGRTEQVKKIEDWLNSYIKTISKDPNKPAESNSARPTN